MNEDGDDEFAEPTVPESDDNGHNHTPNPQQMEDVSSDEEEEEDECRVCRGNAEEGRTLFSPCKCSGSIGLVHQDCLTSWLAVTRGEGRCELCKVKFHFAPQYAGNAPNQLSMTEVFLGLGRRAVARWLPFLVRLAFCITLWLVVAPLVTSYLYLMWMNRSLSCVTERWTQELWPTDAVSGAVLAAVILISFLSLMSFADFLRLEWQQQHMQQQQQQPQHPHERIDPLDPDGRRRIQREAADLTEADRRRRDEVDNVLLERINNVRAQRAEKETGSSAVQPKQPTQPNEEQTEVRDTDTANVDNNTINAREVGDEDENNNNIGANNHNDEEDEDDENNNDEANNDNNNNNDGEPAQNRWNRDDGFPIPPRDDDDQPPLGQPFDNDANMNFDPLLLDDQADMEINVALDELLGLRGPISSLVRNLLWLLVFNTIYLFLFAFIPKSLGSVLYSNVLNTTLFDKALNQLPLIRAENETTMSVRNMVSMINRQSNEVNTIFRLPAFAAINLGYLFCAGSVIMFRFGWVLCLYLRRNKNGNMDTAQPEPAAAAAAAAAARVADPVEAGAGAVDEGDDDDENAGLADVIPNQDEIHGLDDDDPLNPGISFGEAVSLGLDAIVAIVKVGILLFLKMFLLPVLLGIWLDGSAMELFGSSSEDRILYAGTDLFSFILLHWVCGITFMLLVTVSVLQLREVAHPDLLKNMIRPQEPQPNLLGNLMHESVLTQAKRMMLSLGIYTALLHLHVSIPVKILLSSGASKLLPFLKLKFWHILMPRLQVPLELLVFHLTMLALLEKYKNSIGQIQHHWLRIVSEHMGLTRYLLPQEIEKFALVGKLKVSKADGEINSILYDIAKGEGDTDELISSNMQKSKSAKIRETSTEVRTNGDRVLQISQSYISLPAVRLQSSESVTDVTNGGVVLLPTKLGRYRLKRQADSAKDPGIEVWEEVRGNCMERPPENWDDLAAGDAEIQGRWAWGKEKQSAIENRVARRDNFYGPQGKSGLKLFVLITKVILLLFFAWVATSCLLVAIVAVPLGLGRMLYSILRVPDKYIHDPLCFFLGGVVAIPIASFGKSFLGSINVRRWSGSFRLPPTRKFGVLAATGMLWLVVCPLALGLNYELCLIKSPGWFSGEEDFIDLQAMAMSWVVGSVLLNSWAFLCSWNVFSKTFWVNLGNGMLEVDVEQNRRDREQNANAQGNQNGAGALLWQGKNGRTGKFFGILKAVLFHWEWDQVDYVALLVECAIPVSKSLGITFLAPSLCYLLWFWSMDVLVGLSDLPGSHRLYIFRLATASTLFVQLCIAFRAQIQRWVVTLHKTARDDRYLIGEVLLNFQPEVAE